VTAQKMGELPRGCASLRKVFFFQAEDGIRDFHVTGVQTCALPIWSSIEPVAVFEPTLTRTLVPRGRTEEATALLCIRFPLAIGRSEERRVGKECRSRWPAFDGQKNKQRL